MFRELAPVVVGAILGGILTAGPALWVAHRQLNTQVQLAEAAQREQAHQRREQATTSLLAACLDLAQATKEMANSQNSAPKFESAAIKWGNARLKHDLANAMVAVEFPELDG